MLHNLLNGKNDKKNIDRAVESLKYGNLIVYPTDTLYGVGCDIFQKRSVEKIYRLKKLRKNKPLSFICSDFKHLSEYAKVLPQRNALLKQLQDRDGVGIGQLESRQDFGRSTLLQHSLPATDNSARTTRRCRRLVTLEA